ncbi:MAG: glycosyltransferase family 87 protein, partial [Terriglobales bacterium]
MLKDSRLGLLLALLFAASMWFYVQRVLVPYQKADAAAHGRPRGNLSDLYPRWLGTRELLMHHRDPYSPEVTREIQSGYYGRPLDPGRIDDPKDQQGFAYPLHVIFLLAPTIGLPFPVVQTGFRWLLVTLTLASVLLWLRVLRWRPSVASTAILIVLTFGSYAVVQGIKLQQLTLVVSALLAGCAAALVAGHFSLAGFLLALATIKPQLALPVAGWLMLWSVSDWRRRQLLIWSFALTTTIFLAASEYVLPGWMAEFRSAVAAYRQYTGGAGSLLDVLTTQWLGKIIAAAAVIAVAVKGWQVRHEPHDSAAFSAMLALVLAVTLVIVPSFAPYNQILLLPAVFMIAISWRDLWSRGGLTRMACGVGLLVVVWPWLASCGLMLASQYLAASSVQRAWAAPLYTSLGIPLVVLGLLSVCAGDRLKTSSAVG